MFGEIPGVTRILGELRETNDVGPFVNSSSDNAPYNNAWMRLLRRSLNRSSVFRLAYKNRHLTYHSFDETGR